MILRISDRASRDLDDGWTYYDDKEAGLGEYFFNSVVSDIESLHITAGVHRRVFGYHRLICTRFPHAVYYRLDGETIQIWRVLDCRQDPRRIARLLRGG
jgi:plasmid stabilization system protein ParE